MLFKYRLACAVAVALCTASTWVAAGYVSTGVRAYASDTPSGVQFIDSFDGSLSCCLPAASSTVTLTAGNATATLMAQADSLTGTLRQKLNASVAASQDVIGRYSGGASNAYFEGNITLSGPSAGMATFAGILDGTYNIGTRPFPFLDQSIRIQYYVSIGNRFDNNPSRPPYQDELLFTSFGPGTFSIPFSWTQLVSPGDVMHFAFNLRTDVSAVAGLVDFDATNTFKITQIGLPPGYSFTSDATGFLSRFGAPGGPVDPPPVGQLPEPGSLLLVGLAGMLAAAIRRWGS